MYHTHDVLFSGRVISFCLHHAGDELLMHRLVHLLRAHTRQLASFMDAHKIPPVIQINFKKGDGSLEGMYHVSGKRITANIIAFDIYTKPFETVFSHVDRATQEYELLDTFVHELIHNVEKSEAKTQTESKEVMKGLGMTG